MSNVVPFPPLAGAKVPPPGRHLAARFLERPPAHSHAVQFYDDHEFLLDTVAQFLVHALDAGHCALAIATPEHTDGIIERLGKARVASALAEKRLVLADADAVLARFMVAGEISAPAFASAVELLFRDLPRVSEARPLRAFGEMVDRLWQQGNAAAAVQLEELWCQICEKRPEINLLCGYAMGNFYKQDESPRFRDLCQLHTHVLPTERFARTGTSDFDRLREISLLEQRERLLRSEVFYREQLENALREMSRPALRSVRTGAPSGAPPEAGESTASAEPLALCELLEPADELVMIARALLSSPASEDAIADLARLNAASQRLEQAVARLRASAAAAAASVSNP